MSSNVTDESIPRGKLLIHIAENGHSFELDCDESTAVQTVQQYVESMAGIPFNDQLLLCADMKLEPNAPLSAYKLPSDDEEVFCFNKARLQANAPPPPPDQVEIHDIVEPPSPSSSYDPHPLDEAMDPALKALPSYERQFRYHYQCGHAIYSRAVVKFENCERVLREQKVQERAMEIARCNLDYFFRILNQNYLDFLKCYSQQHRVHSDLLVNFVRDIEKLRACSLIPSLQSSSRKCLLDLVKEENLRKWVENCSSSHRQFDNKVSGFKQAFGRLKHDVEDMFSNKASLPIKDLELMIKEHHRYINEQRSIMQSLSKDVSTVKKLVDDCLTSQLTSSLRPHDAVSALGPMYDVHEKNHLPRMRACDRSISNLLDFCVTKKNEMNVFVHSYTQKIAYIQHFIKDVRLQFNAFCEAIKRQETQFEGLRVLRGIGPAYRACLAEIVRRKAAMKLYMGMAGQLADKLASKREAEVRRREEFLKAQSPYIPRDILALMGLFDSPSQCEVNIVPFDTSLLDIDIADIERYAPKYLVGLPFKSEKQGTSRSSVTMSNDGSHLSEDEVSKELLNDYELAEIAGTSKMEVENAKLRAELASAVALICSIGPELDCESLDDSKLDDLMKNAAEKTVEALQKKDEYVKHVESLLKNQRKLCESYEQRIHELEQKLADRYTLERARSCNNDRSEVCGEGGLETPYMSAEHMDEVSSTSNLVEAKPRNLSRLSSKSEEGLDESMADSSGVVNPHLDLTMLDPQREGQQLGDNEEDKMDKQLGAVMPLNVNTDSMTEGLDVSHSIQDAVVDHNLVLELQRAIEEKTNQLSETEIRLKSAVEEVARLGRELETSQKLLDESQMNCAHLENCLHEARQEAQTHLCAADRRASQYNALRSSSLKMRSLFERLRSCVNSPSGVVGFVDSLRSLAQSLTNSAGDNETEGAAEFRACISALADKVGFLSRQRAEILDRFSKAESAHTHLMKELEERKELVKTLYAKLQLEKQANKEKISLYRFEVHEIAAFILTATGHYEAINRNRPNHFLSTESVALFTDHLPDRPPYIVGQIVHIERRTVKPSITAAKPDQVDQLTSDTVTNCLGPNLGSGSGPGSDPNPYGLPIGCEYFVVTVAMLPEKVIHSPPLTS